MPRVRIDLEPTSIWTVTDANGQFRFGFVAPGDYTLRARLLDFAPVQQTVQVEKDGVHQVTIHVTFPPVTRPYHVTQILDGFLDCTANGIDCPVYGSPNARTRFEVNVAPDLAGVLAEIVWQPNIVPKDLSRFRALGFYQDEPIARNHTAAPAPYLRLHLSPADLHKITEPGLFVEVRSEEFQVNERYAGAAYEQPFTVYLTTFWVLDRSQGFSAVPSE